MFTSGNVKSIRNVSDRCQKIKFFVLMSCDPLVRNTVSNNLLMLNLVLKKNIELMHYILIRIAYASSEASVKPVNFRYFQSIHVASITQLRTCVMKIVTFKGSHPW